MTHQPSSADFSLSTTDYDDEDADEISEVHERMSQKYRIRLHATNLPTLSVLRGTTPPDTFAVVTSVATPATTQACPSSIPVIRRPSAAHVRNVSTASNSSTASASVIWGQTEVVYKSRNPQWTSTITIDYVTGSGTFFYVHIFRDCPGRTDHLKGFGTALIHVADVLSTKHLTRVKRLRSGGCLFCRLEPVRDSSDLTRTVRLQLQAINLLPSRNKALFAPRKLDTVLEISRRGSMGWMVVHRSVPARGSTNPVYDAVNLNLEDLCGSNFDRHLRISVYAVKAQQVKRLIGITETTLRHLLSHSERALDDNDVSSVSGDEDGEGDECAPKRTVELLLQRSVNKLKEVGRIRVLKASLRSGDGSPMAFPEQSPSSEIVDLAKLSPLALPSVTPTRSFSSYIEQGCQIDFCVAIDFTSSNGDPAKEDSYHHLGENALNDYEETILAIGQALARYSESNEYAVWGFGAKFGDAVRHIFQCGPTPTVPGVDGILAAYKSVFQSDLTMSGPTVVTQVLQAAAARAKRNHDANREKPRYTVLLIITDGIVDNFEETRQRLDIYSDMPLSVVFVGVGRSDFGLMHQLCQPTAATTRCNTTFVEFRRHQHEPAALGEAALRNIPLQLCQYMQMQGI